MGTEILSNISLFNPLQLKQPGEMMAKTFSDFPAPIVRQLIRRSERNVDPGDFSVSRDQERLCPADVAGEFLPDFANSRHLHRDHLSVYFIILNKYVNICVHIYINPGFVPFFSKISDSAENLDTSDRRGTLFQDKAHGLEVFNSI